MWVVTTRGFLSAVEHREEPDTIIVRARVRGDLDQLKPVVKGLRRRAFRDDSADYCYRVHVTREEWREALSLFGERIDYGNFKDAVKQEQGPVRAGIYMSVWSALTRLESRFAERYYGAYYHPPVRRRGTRFRKQKRINLDELEN
jgi:hypothetical protein